MAVVGLQRGEDLVVADRCRARPVKPGGLERRVPGAELAGDLGGWRPSRTFALPPRGASVVAWAPVGLGGRSALELLPGTDRTDDLPFAERLAPPRPACVCAAATSRDAGGEYWLAAPFAVVRAYVASGGVGGDSEQLADLGPAQPVSSQAQRLAYPLGERQLDHGWRREPGQRQHFSP